MAEPAQARLLSVESAGAPKPVGVDLAATPATFTPGGPDRYINRELSWLHFNRRVLEEAENPHHPLLERVRFLSISASNLDEFFMVRVAGLKGQVRERVRVISQDGLTPSEALEKVNLAANALMQDQQREWRRLRTLLGAEGLEVVDPSKVSKAERAKLEPVFETQLFPVLTPLAIDPAHPFPFIPNLGFTLALKLKRQSDGRELYALVPVPQQMKRFWELPETGRKEGRPHRRYLPLEGGLAPLI